MPIDHIIALPASQIQYRIDIHPDIYLDRYLFDYLSYGLLTYGLGAITASGPSSPGLFGLGTPGLNPYALVRRCGEDLPFKPISLFFFESNVVFLSEPSGFRNYPARI